MSFLAALPIIGKVLDGVFSIVDKAVLDKDEAARLKATIQMQMLSADHTEVTKLLEAQAAIIMSETRGQSYLQRNWRPLLMLIFMIIIANNYILFPYLSLFTKQTVMLELPDFMWNILQIGIGGYIAGRSGEKIVKMWKENKGE